MKIIANAANDKFLIEASETELANLIGFRYPSQIDRNHQSKKVLKIGAEITVSPGTGPWGRLARCR